ncbi:hypothetical protein ACLESO_39320 [Pyxidicoccus sp. 3LG]
MGGFAKALSKGLDLIKPLVTAANPLLGAAMGFAKGLMEGKNPLESALGAVTDLIPGSSVFKSTLEKFAGPFLMNGEGGNSLLSGALNMFGGKGGGVTDIVGELMKGMDKKQEQLDQQGQQNLIELAAQRMSRLQLE